MRGSGFSAEELDITAMDLGGGGGGGGVDRNSRALFGGKATTDSAPYKASCCGTV